MAKTMIQYIKEAARKLVGCKLQRLGAAKTQEILNGVMQTVGLESMEEVYLFVAQFDLTCRDKVSNMDNLSDYFECSSLDMVEYVPALKSLERKGILSRCYRREENIFKQQFVVSDTVMAAVIDNQPVVINQVHVDDVQIDKYEFCRRIAEKIENRDVVTDDIIPFVEKLENNNPHLLFVEELKADVKDVLDRTLFYNMCYENFNDEGNGFISLRRIVSDIFSNISWRIQIIKSIVEGEHILIKLGLIETDGGDFIQLSDEGKEFYYGEDAQAFCKSYKCHDIYAFLERVHQFFHYKQEYDSGKGEHYCSNVLDRTLLKFENSNKHLPEVGIINKLIQDEFERVLFYSIGYDMMNDYSTSLSYEIKHIYPFKMRKKVIEEFKDNVHNLQKQGLVEIEKSSSLFGEQTDLAMTEKGKEKLFGKDAALYIDKVSDKQLLLCDKIAEKKLYFSNNLEEQLSLLRNSLREEYYQGIAARLEENHLPKGMSVLFYGGPGTGKTESVLQIAKATGRAIMHVDISATKSCWFGESEKLIKKVFRDYRRICEKSKVTPILLFNEADAVFSKRKDVGNGSVDQTENAIQNIILEEMENLGGILFATTNLVDNLDDAFERRFLFKIRFDNPSTEAKRNIWMDKLPSLSKEDAQTLASNYEFSGGQIDNIVRKTLMQEVIKGEKPTLKSLIMICNEEKISKNNGRRVGYR